MRALRAAAVAIVLAGALLVTANTAEAGPDKKDHCTNIEGVQPSVPHGYRRVKGECFPKESHTAGEFKGTTSYVFGVPCGFAHQTFDVGFGRFSPYGSGSIHVEGCAEFGTTTDFLDFVGTFTLSTLSGPISGTATGLVSLGVGVAAGDPIPFDLLLTPTVPGDAIRMTGIWTFGGAVPAVDDRVDGSLTLE